MTIEQFGLIREGEAIGKRSIYMGETGSGYLVKLVHNQVPLSIENRELGGMVSFQEIFKVVGLSRLFGPYPADRAHFRNFSWREKADSLHNPFPPRSQPAKNPN